MCPLFHTRPINKKFYTSAHSYCFTISFSDESKEEGVVYPFTKEEEDVKVMWSWMEVGGCPAHPEEEAKGLLAEVSSSPGSPFLLPLSTSHPIPISSPHNFCIPFLLAVSFSSSRDYRCYSGLARRERRHES